MKDYTEAYPDREMKVFWAEHEGRVLSVQGFFCEGYSDIFWVPELNLSLTVKYNLFESKEEAIKKAKVELSNTLREVKRKLAVIDAMNT